MKTPVSFYVVAFVFGFLFSNVIAALIVQTGPLGGVFFGGIMCFVIHAYDKDKRSPK